MCSEYDRSSLKVFDQFQDPTTIQKVADNLRPELPYLSLKGDSLVGYIMHMVDYGYLETVNPGNTWTTVYKLSPKGVKGNQYFHEIVAETTPADISQGPF